MNLFAQSVVMVNKMEEEFKAVSNNLDNISKKIRLFRKPLVEKYFDTVREYENL